MNVTLNSVNIIEYNDDVKSINKWANVTHYEVDYANSAIRLYMNTGKFVFIKLGSTTYTDMTEFEAAVLGFMDVDARAFKVFTALVSQTGTAAPSVIELQNSIGDIIWERDSAGVYTGTLAGAFTADKTVVNNVNIDDTEICLITTTSDVITLTCTADDLLVKTPIEIKVFA